jgi:CRISPR system Cascade subunit CasB
MEVLNQNEKKEITQKENLMDIFLESLRNLSRGERAVLKRAAGFEIAKSRGGMEVFYRILPRALTNSRNEEIYFLVATLYSLNNHALTGNFGLTLRKVKESTKSSSTDKRMAALLDSNFDLLDDSKPGGGELSYRLRQCVRLAASKDIGVNWRQLLQDLLLCTHPAKFVQKQWARSYFTEQVKKEGESRNEIESL